MSMHGSAMMYVTASYSTDVISPSISSRSNHVGVVREAVCVRDVLGVDARDVGTPRGLLHRRDQAVDQFTRALEERRLRNDLVEPRRMTAPQPGGVGVVREAEDRDVRVRVRDVVGIDARDVRDYEVGWLDPVGGLEAVLRQEPLELAPDEEVDPTEQDRRHA
jgi:hypothetical protein